MEFKYDELFEESARQTRVGRRGQAEVYGVRHTGVKEIESRMGHQSFTLAFQPGLEAETDEGIFQDFVVRLHSPDRQTALPGDIGEIEQFAGGRCGHFQETVESPEVADKPLHLDLFPQVRFRVCLEGILFLRVVESEERRKGPEAQRIVQIEMHKSVSRKARREGYSVLNHFS